MPVWAYVVSLAGSVGLGGAAGYAWAVSRTDRIVASLSGPELEVLDRRVRARRALAGTGSVPGTGPVA
jgi:hypothetical protein